MCSDVGAELIQVDSLEENDIIVSMASKQETQLSNSLTGQCFIGICLFKIVCSGKESLWIQVNLI